MYLLYMLPKLFFKFMVCKMFKFLLSLLIKQLCLNSYLHRC